MCDTKYHKCPYNVKKYRVMSIKYTAIEGAVARHAPRERRDASVADCVVAQVERLQSAGAAVEGERKGCRACSEEIVCASIEYTVIQCKL